MTNNISEVRQLLKLFGFDSVKRSQLESLAEAKATTFQKLAQESKEYASLTTHKTDKIFLILPNKVVPLVSFSDISFLVEPVKTLQPKINATAEKHNITGLPEYKLYRVVKDGHMKTMTNDELFKEPVSFARSVFINSKEKTAFLLKDENTIEKVKKQASIIAIVCNVRKFGKKDASLTSQEKLSILEDRTKATLQTIREFLSLSPNTSPKKEKKKKPKKAKKPEPVNVVSEKVTDLIAPFLTDPVLAEKVEIYFTLEKSSDYATGLEWFHRCPQIMKELLLV